MLKCIVIQHFYKWQTTRTHEEEHSCVLIRATSRGVDEVIYSVRLPAKNLLPWLLALVQMC